MPHIKPEQFPNFPITRFSGYYFGQLMGEYVLTNIVNNERNFFQSNEKQKESEWFRKGKILNYRSIFDLSVGIFGLGTIGNRSNSKKMFLRVLFNFLVTSWENFALYGR